MLVSPWSRGKRQSNQKWDLFPSKQKYSLVSLRKGGIVCPIMKHFAIITHWTLTTVTRQQLQVATLRKLLHLRASGSVHSCRAAWEESRDPAASLFGRNSLLEILHRPGLIQNIQTSCDHLQREIPFRLQQTEKESNCCADTSGFNSPGT